MRIGGIGNDDNPFLKKMFEDGGSLQNINDGDKSGKIDSPIDTPRKTEGADEVKKPGMEEGAASNNTNQNPKQLIDRSQFTSDDELQEIDLQEFDDEL